MFEVGNELNLEDKQNFKNFLLKNLDVFVWIHKDMLGIDPKVNYHQLNVDPKFTLHRQRRRILNLERYEVLKEVQKLISNWFIKEAAY